MIKLYLTPGTRAGRVAWLLEELNIQYDLEVLPFTKEGLKSPEHRSRHALGRVPVIEDGNVSIFESAGRSWLELIIKSLRRMRGDDPTMVIVPPKMAQNPIGIKRRESGISVLTEILLTTGRNKAAAPTFCIKLEITPTLLETIGTMRASLLPPCFNIVAATLLIKPVLSRPAPIIMTAIIESTALDEKPVNKSEGSGKRFICGN